MTSAASKTVKLNSGHDLPLVGLGTWQGSVGSEAEQELISTIVYAINEQGYRHLDTAALYGVEEIVGKAVRASGVARSELFITTKLASADHARVEEAFLESLQRLGLDYIDLYLIHWPQSLTADGKSTKTPTPAQTWQALEAVQRKYPDKLRSLGVSNFSQKTLDELLAVATITPAVNQVEIHPMLPQFALVDYFKSKGIVTMAYSPLGQYDSPILKSPEINAVAVKHNVGPGQVVLAWEVGRGIAVIPKSASRTRIRDNITLPQLDDQDVAVLDGFHALRPDYHRRLCQINGGTPTGHDIVLGWTYEELGWDHFTYES
ncbi:NADP-dependent oxidoreductase domain-containing protein [Lipomyces japonicus]|uniref:NADP-dependent oxidoreductase domain-containing protein n=1 Tax=Lipomyces japonicus TaxID=56871 RepID=UPI0034CFE5CA